MPSDIGFRSCDYLIGSVHWILMLYTFCSTKAAAAIIPCSCDKRTIDEESIRSTFLSTPHETAKSSIQTSNPAAATFSIQVF
jgi:hypothetical protein